MNMIREEELNPVEMNLGGYVNHFLHTRTLDAAYTLFTNTLPVELYNYNKQVFILVVVYLKSNAIFPNDIKHNLEVDALLYSSIDTIELMLNDNSIVGHLEKASLHGLVYELLTKSFNIYKENRRFKRAGIWYLAFRINRTEATRIVDKSLLETSQLSTLYMDLIDSIKLESRKSSGNPINTREQSDYDANVYLLTAVVDILSMTHNIPVNFINKLLDIEGYNVDDIIIERLLAHTDLSLFIKAYLDTDDPKYIRVLELIRHRTLESVRELESQLLVDAVPGDYYDDPKALIGLQNQMFDNIYGGLKKLCNGDSLLETKLKDLVKSRTSHLYSNNVQMTNRLMLQDNIMEEIINSINFEFPEILSVFKNLVEKRLIIRDDYDSVDYYPIHSSDNLIQLKVPKHLILMDKLTVKDIIESYLPSDSFEILACIYLSYIHMVYIDFDYDDGCIIELLSNVIR